MSRITTILLVAGSIAVFSGCPHHDDYRFTNASVYGNQNGIYSPATDDGAEGTGTSTAEEPREVVEPDVYRVDGNILYVLNQHRGLALINLDNNAILCRVPIYGMPRDLYIDGGRAYVLVSNAVDYTAEGNTVSYEIRSCLYVVDIEDPANAQVISQFEFEGDLIDSRIVGDILYAVCVERPLWWGGGWWWGVAEVDAVAGTADGTVVGTGASTTEDPDGGTTEPGEPPDGEQPEDIVQSWVTSINIADVENIYKADEVSFESLGNIIHCTDSAIFVAAEDTTDETASTLITYVDIQDAGGEMSVRGNILVEGYVRDKFKMDAYNGVLRVVAALGQQWMGNSGVAVTTVDLADPDNLTVLGSLELEGAVDESLFATRFDGPRAYVVTYKIVDPLFVLDLSNPAAPALLGQLVVPGWSTYIEPRGDRLIALGVDVSDGKRRVCVSLYDVSGPEDRPPSEDPWEPVLLDRETFGEDWSWSNADNEVKAFTVLDGLVLVPFSGYTEQGWYNRLQFVTYTEDDLDARGYCEQRGNILRSFEYDSLYYCLTDKELATIDASDLGNPQVVNHLVLSENVFDYFEVGTGAAVEIINDWEDPVTTVRLHAPEKEPGELKLELGGLVSAMPYGGDAVLVGTGYGDCYKVAVVDCSSESAPALISQFDVKVSPFGYYCYPMPMDVGVRPMPAVADEKDVAIGGWYPQSGQAVYLLGNKLVLKCWAPDYDVDFGSDQVYGFGLAVVNLDDAQYTTVGLGYLNPVSVEGAGDSMYIGTWEDVSSGAEPQCAYYLQALNVNTLEMGPAVNVPGMYVDYDPAQDLLFVRDDQWDASGNITSGLRTVRWDGGEGLTPLDSLGLPPNTWNILRRGGSLFAMTYENGTVLLSGTVDGDGNLETGPKALVTQDWAGILGARPGVAYMTVNSAVLRYDLVDGQLTLTGLHPAMGYPTNVRFGANYDYVCLGYSGVLALPK
ncbi:MAG: beta-propeller domain-containing protein [Candidatus Hydrogenedentes bacterium]|nr:beta-propeller domain-containing protein [Candidatus Hydrogenedentota bacterium]